MANPSVPIRCAGKGLIAANLAATRQRLCRKSTRRPQFWEQKTATFRITNSKQSSISRTTKAQRLGFVSCALLRVEQPALLSLIACFRFRLTARLLLNLSLKQLHTTNLYEYSYTPTSETICNGNCSL